MAKLIEWDLYNNVCKKRFDDFENNIKDLLNNGVRASAEKAEEHASAAWKLGMWNLGTLIVVALGMGGALFAIFQLIIKLQGQ